MKPDLNPASVRTHLARGFTSAKKNKLPQLVFVVIVALTLFGSALLTLKGSFGWFVLSLIAWPLMILIGYKWWLKELPPKVNPVTIDEVLDVELLGLLPDKPSPKQIAEAVMKTGGGQFFAVRFGLGSNFLTELSSDDPLATKAVWQKAIEVKDQMGSKGIYPPFVLVALVSVLPNADSLLAKLQLSQEDILQGVHWFGHLKQLVENAKDRRIKGGIGRDLSFGYTPLLDRFGVNLSETMGNSLIRHLDGHKDVRRQLVNAIGDSARPHVVLIGSLGVGKTTLIHSLAADLLNPPDDLPKQLRFNQMFAIDPSVLISQAKKPGELEALLNSIIVEAAKAKNVVIFLDNAELFFKEGTGSVDLSSAILPTLESSGLKIIMAMDEQSWLKLSTTSADIAQRLQRVNLTPMNEFDTMKVAQNHILTTEFRLHVTYMYQSLRVAYNLGQRYIKEEVMPGQAIKILEDAAQFAENGLVTGHSVEQAVEKTYGVKVGSANTADERNKLIGLEDSLHERMINQSRAVSVVSEALRRARSGVRNPNRPIGSFLFLGPTGVGKTELAKALAAVYFGGEDRLIRLDLNEFGQAKDVSRLIAQASTNKNSLTAQVSKQPFSVILLDEIEKAHASVLDTLLQLLDEGVLRDTSNREVSFKDAIVIATSNAGSGTIREAISKGLSLESFEKQFIDSLINADKFRPEFLNRFDEIVLFRPLTADELKQVLDLILKSVNAILANQHVSVNVADDAKLKLVEVGNDPRLGARPMRRIVQRTVENIVANRLLKEQASAGQVIQISLKDIEGELNK